MDENSFMLEVIDDAALTTACVEAVRQAIRNSEIEISRDVERAVIAKGTRLLLDAGAYLCGGFLFLPTLELAN